MQKIGRNSWRDTNKSNQAHADARVKGVLQFHKGKYFISREETFWQGDIISITPLI